MREEFKPAIDALQADIVELERKTYEAKLFLNQLCERAGIAPIYPEQKVNADVPVIASTAAPVLRSDAFYGKVITVAAREFLEMRRGANLGPASPKEVCDALAKGGYWLNLKEPPKTAVISVRGALRSNPEIFRRLPDGAYGLSSWYQKAKIEQSGHNEGNPRKAAKAARRKKTRGKSKPPIAPFIEKVMANSAVWTTESLRQEAIRQQVPGVDSSTTRNSFHGALLGLMRKGRVEQTGTGGGWRTIKASGSNNVKGLFDAA